VSPELTVAEVVEATSADVWRLHAHLVGRPDADDLTQETFLRVLRALPGFRGDSSLRVWVLSIASRTAADEIRRRERSRRLFKALPVPVPAGDDHAITHARADLLARLHPARHESFVLTQVLGCSYAEAAAIAQCPVCTVRSRVARARADLLADYRSEV